MATTAALAGQHEMVAEIRDESMRDIEAETDAIRNNGLLGSLAIALAISGDTHGSWEEIKALIDQPSGFTIWDLKLHPGFRGWFGKIAEYQSLLQ